MIYHFNVGSSQMGEPGIVGRGRGIRHARKKHSTVVEPEKPAPKKSRSSLREIVAGVASKIEDAFLKESEPVGDI
jgi:hypothetical protein